MDDARFLKALHDWFHPSQVRPEGVLWDVNDEILPWEAVEQQYLWYRRIGKALQPKRLLEVGVGFGYSTLAMLSDLEEPPEVWWIDNESGWSRSIDHAQDCMWDGYGIRGRWYKDWSRFCKSAKTIPQFDLIHVDAGHTYDDVLIDLELASYVRADEGHILVHDTDDPPVSEAIGNFVKRHVLNILHLPNVRCGLKVIHEYEEDCPLELL